MNKYSVCTLLCMLNIFSVSYAQDPLVIAHAGGKALWPANTLFALHNAHKAGVYAIEVDVQVTKDGIPVLYHPRDLSVMTEGAGTIANKPLSYIKSLNAAWKFEKNGHYPYRRQHIEIPTLKEALDALPQQLFIIDMKSLPEEDLVTALVETLSEKDWKRLIFYSTNHRHLDLLRASRPEARMFEPRGVTRQRLLRSVVTETCEDSDNTQWIGFEMMRTMSVVETFALGSSKTDVAFTLWDEESVSCTKKMAPDAKIVFFESIHPKTLSKRPILEQMLYTQTTPF